ncbi:hypothetical protein IJ579_01760 [bacterium]|nr:hypothetical protein [bacterium]
MHKSVLVYNSDYQITPQKEVTVEQKTLPSRPVQIQPQPLETSVTQVQTQTTELAPKIIHVYKESTPTVKVETQSTKVQPQQQVKTTKTTSVPKTTQTDYGIDVKEIAKRTVQNNVSQTTIQDKPIQQQTKVAPQTTTQKIINSGTFQTTKTQPVKILTAQEEEIAWNKWRSDLQNKIMQDVKLPAVPSGTIFRFTFNVDKFGKITNVQTWSDTSKYTPYAIQYMAPVIRSYQGRSILNFPSGSNRTSTIVVGGWKIAANTKLSTPQDFNDTERIKK